MGATASNSALAGSTNGLPPALGQQNMANSLPVVVASDQSNINVVAQTGTNNIGNVSLRINAASISPSNALATSLGLNGQATYVTASASGTNATVSASLPAVAAKTNALAGFIITGLPATSLSSADVTITGLISGTWTLEFAESVGNDNSFTAFFTEVIPASATNTAIQVSVAALGASSAKVSVQVFGHVF